jgi:MATE family multidrug resistance protein
VRVGNELGAGHPRAAAFSVVVVTALSFVITLAMAVVFLVFRDYLSYIFTEGETVARAVSDLCPLLATTLILNGIQPVLSGTYRTRHPDNRSARRKSSALRLK